MYKSDWKFVDRMNVPFPVMFPLMVIGTVTPAGVNNPSRPAISTPFVNSTAYAFPPVSVNCGDPYAPPNRNRPSCTVLFEAPNARSMLNVDATFAIESPAPPNPVVVPTTMSVPAKSDKI
jgi:hypothetical protein